MPGFRTHTTINLLALAGLAVSGIWEGRVEGPLLGIGAASFVVATFLLSPDLDLKHSSPTRNWGPLRWFWRPYQWLFRHRGLSHSVLFSSMTRIFYLLVILAALFAVAVHQGFPAPASWQDELVSHRLEWSAVGIGIFLSDLTHILADRLGSSLKILVNI